MIGVERRHALPDPVAHGAAAFAGEAVEPPPHEVAPGMASKRIGGQERRVHEQDHASHPDSDPPVAEEGLVGVGVQDEDERDGEIKRVAVQVLDHQEPGLPPVAATPDRTDGAGRRRAEKRAIIRLAIVVAGGPERPREDEDQEGGGGGKERRPPRRPRSEPGMRERGRAGSGRIDEQRRRVERRDIRAVGVIRALERGPRRIHGEATQAQDRQERSHPKAIGARRLRESDEVTAGARCLCHPSPPFHVP